MKSCAANQLGANQVPPDIFNLPQSGGLHTKSKYTIRPLKRSEAFIVLRTSSNAIYHAALNSQLKDKSGGETAILAFSIAKSYA